MGENEKKKLLGSISCFSLHLKKHVDSLISVHFIKISISKNSFKKFTTFFLHNFLNSFKCIKYSFKYIKYFKYLKFVIM